MYKYLKGFDNEGFQLQADPSYFYLDWNKREATWRTINNAPKENKLAFQSIVKWKQLKGTINVCTNYRANTTEATLACYSYIDNPYSNYSFLKSHLQKAIRRSDIWKSIKTCYLMMDLDVIGLLRRLSVIAIEDCLPLEGYNILVWFCAAVSKGYQLSEAQRCWVLGYCYKLACFKWREAELDGGQNKWPYGGPFPITKCKLYRLDDHARNLVYSIAFRRNYGGRGGDCKMFDRAAELWTKRFMQKNEYISLLSGSTPLITPPSETLKLNEWIIGAIDFHCVPAIVHNLQEHYEQYDEEDIKNAIWVFSSSITNKELLPGTSSGSVSGSVSGSIGVEVWNTIRKRFISLAKFQLKIAH